MTIDDRLTSYRLFGRTGLRVSPLALGAMSFGEGGWHTGRDAARSIFTRYVQAGGNFIDTADVYGAGASERLLGELISEAGIRDRLVLATKFGVAGTGRPELSRPRPQAHAGRPGRLAPPATGRLCRPVLAARMGRGDAGRRGDVDLRRAGQEREDPGGRG